VKGERFTRNRILRSERSELPQPDFASEASLNSRFMASEASLSNQILRAKRACVWFERAKRASATRFCERSEPQQPHFASEASMCLVLASEASLTNQILRSKLVYGTSDRASKIMKFGALLEAALEFYVTSSALPTPTRTEYVHLSDL